MAGLTRALVGGKVGGEDSTADRRFCGSISRTIQGAVNGSAPARGAQPMCRGVAVFDVRILRVQSRVSVPFDEGRYVWGNSSLDRSKRFPFPRNRGWMCLRSLLRPVGLRFSALRGLPAGFLQRKVTDAAFQDSAAFTVHAARSRRNRCA